MDPLTSPIEISPREATASLAALALLSAAVAASEKHGAAAVPANSAIVLVITSDGQNLTAQFAVRDRMSPPPILDDALDVLSGDTKHLVAIGNAVMGRK